VEGVYYCTSSQKEGRQIEIIHTAGPLVPDPSSIGFEIVVAKLKRYKSPCHDQIPAELI
jgi:hypothetical protein